MSSDSLPHKRALIRSNASRRFYAWQECGKAAVRYCFCWRRGGLELFGLSLRSEGAAELAPGEE